MTRPLVAMYVKYIAPRYSGAGAQAVALARALGAEGLDVVALTEATAERPGPYELGGLRVLPFHPATDVTGLQVDRVRSLLRVLRTLPRPVAFHAHSAYPEASLMGAALRLHGIPTVLKVTMHRSDADCTASRITGRVHRRLLRRQSAIVAISSEIREELLALGVAPRRIASIPNGVDTARFRPRTPEERRALRARFGLPPGAPVAAFVGMLIPRKNVAFLLDAWTAWRRERGSDAQLLLAGPADEAGAAALAARVRALDADAASGVRWAGPVADVEAVFGAADLFVLPSHAEGLPNVALEAMASGLPVALAECSGVRDILGTPAQGGETFRADDDAALRRALDLLCAPAEARAARGAAARARAEAGFALSTVARRYAALYRRLESGGPAAE